VFAAIFIDLAIGIPLASNTLRVLEKEDRMLLMKRFLRIGKLIPSQPLNLLPGFVFKKMIKRTTRTPIPPKIKYQFVRIYLATLKL